MSLSVSPIRLIPFKANPNKQETKPKEAEQNPINEKGERSKLVLGTFVAGLGFGTEALFELLDGDFIGDTIVDKGKNIANKNFKNASNARRTVATVAAVVGIMGAFVAALAALYTLFHAPKINYDAKVNTFAKTKDMDVYIKSTKVEGELYDQIGKEAEKDMTQEEKEELKAQYALLKKAKSEVPAFAKFGH